MEPFNFIFYAVFVFVIITTGANLFLNNEMYNLCIDNTPQGYVFESHSVAGLFFNSAEKWCIYGALNDSNREYSQIKKYFFYSPNYGYQEVMKNE